MINLKSYFAVSFQLYAKKGASTVPAMLQDSARKYFGYFQPIIMKINKMNEKLYIRV